MIRYLRRASTGLGNSNWAVFCDRDGVLNQRIEGGYVVKPDQLHVLEIATPFLVAAQHAGALVIIVTNQGCISRGIATETEIMGINGSLLRALEAQGVQADAIYMCEHHPQAIRPEDRECHCRKPKPGMLEQAKEDFRLSLGDSWFIGDTPSDRAAANAAGLPADRYVDVATIGQHAVFWSRT